MLGKKKKERKPSIDWDLEQGREKDGEEEEKIYRCECLKPNPIVLMLEL